MPRALADTDVDVLDVSDLRLEGGTSGSVAEEIVAQARAGYTTALRNVASPLLAKVAPLNRRIRGRIDAGDARLTLPQERVRARLVVVRHPTVLQNAAEELSGIEAEQVVVVANAAPRDIDGYEHYRVDAVRDASLAHFGVEPVWAPIGPLVRKSISGTIGGQRVLVDDWVNIIDVDAWAVPRDQWVGEQPVIGRHSRDNRQKWPSDPGQLRAAYPVDGSMDVRILGGAAAAGSVLGEIPPAWDVRPFGAMSPQEFLAGLDFFVYFHNPRWVEAFGRTILEALASGAVAILPEHFRVLFGDAACYTTPDGVQRLVRQLYEDRHAYEAQVERGRLLARESFGHEAHVSRLAELIGPPSGTKNTPAPARVRESDRQTRGTQPPVAVATRDAGTRGPETPGPGAEPVLFVSSNGSGMGHLTRLLAYAEHRPAGTSARFLSLSQAVPVVGRFGHPYEYIPSMNATGLFSARWQDYFATRAIEAIERIGPVAVVFDGTVPYEKIPAVRDAHPDVPWIWSRRGMWYRGYNRDQLAKAAWFDLVIEPGELASPADRGVTSRAPATRVGPVTVLDPDDIDGREDARRALGLEDDRPAALVTLGAGNINDAGSDIRVVLDVLRSHGAQICVTRPAIAERVTQLVDDTEIHVVSEYPLSRRYRAFDVAVSAAGYNSVHELLRFGVPSLFIPNLDTALDDQRTRAQYLAGQGWAHCVEDAEPAQVGKLVDDLLTRGDEMVAGVAAIDPGNGAGEAMRHILATARTARGVAR